MDFENDQTYQEILSHISNIVNDSKYKEIEAVAFPSKMLFYVEDLSYGDFEVAAHLNKNKLYITADRGYLGHKWLRFDSKYNMYAWLLNNLCRYKGKKFYPFIEPTIEVIDSFLKRHGHSDDLIEFKKFILNWKKSKNIMGEFDLFEKNNELEDVKVLKVPINSYWSFEVERTQWANEVQVALFDLANKNLLEFKEILFKIFRGSPIRLESSLSMGKWILRLYMGTSMSFDIKSHDISNMYDGFTRKFVKYTQTIVDNNPREFRMTLTEKHIQTKNFDLDELEQKLELFEKIDLFILTEMKRNDVVDQEFKNFGFLERIKSFDKFK